MKSAPFLRCLCLLLPLASCSRSISAPPTSLFEGAAAQNAVQKLTGKIPAHAKVLKVEIGSQKLLIQAQDPAAPTHVDAYVYALPAETVSGPTPVEVSLVHQNLEEDLFDLSEVNFSAVAAAAREAVERVALDGGGAVDTIRIERGRILLPTPRSTAVGWEISVRGPRERAAAHADASGHITALDIKNTARAKALDFFAGGQPLADAIALIRKTFGEERVFVNMDVPSAHYLMFQAKDPQPPHAVKRYICDVNGISKAGGSDPLILGDVESKLFSLKDLDWSRYDALKTAALEKLAIPEGRISAVSVARATSAPGRPQPVQWQLSVRGQGQGAVFFDQKGAIVRSKKTP